MTWLWWLSAGLLVVTAFWASFPAVRAWLIVCERAPVFLREFFAATAVHGGPMRTLLHCALASCSRMRLPGWVIAAIGRGIARQQGGNLAELEQPLERYATLDALFTRQINPALRPICAAAEAIVSPVDADVLDVGVVAAGTLIQAKGMPYRLMDLLPMAEADRCEGGAYAVLYLRAGDCHRVFCPADDAQVRACVAIPGRTMPVAPAVAARVRGLYTQNKRLGHWLETPQGGIGLVMIGAYLVGDMDCTYDRRPWPRRCAAPVRRDYAAGVASLARGQWMATFHLGSTVVLLFEPGHFEPIAGLVGRKVRYGEQIGRWHSHAINRALARMDVQR